MYSISFQKISTNADVSAFRKNLLRSKNSKNMTTSDPTKDWISNGYMTPGRYIKKSVLKNPQEFSRNEKYGIMRVPQSLWSAKNRVSRCTSMRVGRLWHYIVISEAHNPGHIYKVTTWWGVSVCKKSKAKQNKQIKKSDNRKPFLLAGDQLIIWLESFGSQDSCEQERKMF